MSSEGKGLGVDGPLEAYNAVAGARSPVGFRPDQKPWLHAKAEHTDT